VVETTKKMSRIVKMSTNDTMMIDGARFFLTANFIAQNVDLFSRDRGAGRRYLPLRDHFARHSTVVAF
jgi:2-C-methyl-D-erythritol 4-phosphate cytidylyltransferase